MKNEPIDLHHATLIRHACTILQSPISEYNFSNLYLFRNIHKYKLSTYTKDHYIIIGESYTHEPFLMPLFRPTDWAALIHTTRETGAHFIFPINEEWFPDVASYSIELCEDDFDYIYDVETFTTYHGRHLDGQRNLVKKLLSSHSVSCIPYSPEYAEEVLFIVETWEKEKKSPANSDVSACKDLIHFFSYFDLKGYIFQVDGKTVGFIFGEAFFHDTFLVHFAKAIGNIRGIYQHMYQELAKKLYPTFKWMNWEEDLGIDVLRYAKRSYHPSQILKKGRLIV